ncbi:MAG: hypothetical protein BEN18_06470 [Epulopiscium sp. Nuni2H_MBin001]|nr:MAG: hypothetical protein BEN18_06470 [Epulopiscium sp. Nuni2H_MBin001]
MGDLLTNYLQQGVFLDKHDAIAILDTYNNIYHIVLDKKNYFAPLKSQAILDIFLEHEDTRMYINANSRLKYHLNGNIQDKITVSINKGNFKYLINFFYLHQHDIYLYCVDVLDDDCLYLDIVSQTSENLQKVKHYNEQKSLTNMLVILSKNSFFKYDIEKDHITFYKDFQMTKAYWELKVSDFYRYKLVEKDIDVFTDFINSMNAGEKNVFDFRLKFSEHKIPWISVLYDISYKNGSPVKAFGIIKDIDEEVKYKLKSERDLLTGCYNKMTAEDLITETLKKDLLKGTCYLLLIDIDNFKAINDNMGHAYGDLVLTTLANRLRGIFREVDVVARIGGDEFLVFLKNFKVEEVLIERLNKITEAFLNTYSDGIQKYQISGSIGVSSYPKDGDTFTTLYKKADAAMYHAKKQGKNQFAIYKNDMETAALELQITRFETIKRNSCQFIDIQLCFSIFEILYSSHNPNETILKVFGILGNLYNIDRCYVIALDWESDKFTHQYQWCQKGILESVLTEITITEVNSMVSLYDEKGIGIFTNTDNLPKDIAEIFQQDNIKSMLNCSIQKEGKISLIIGYDKCSTKTSWDTKTINTLVFLAKIIAIYLISKRINVLV